MGFLYSFVKLDAQQSSRRRQLLDRYGQIAQLSALVPLLVISVSYLSRFIIRRYARFLLGSSNKEHQSPRVSTFRRSTAGSWKLRWRRFCWALDDELMDGWDGWGTRREWAIACLWALWLLLLVVKDTGDGMCDLTSLHTLRFPAFTLFPGSSLEMTSLSLSMQWRVTSPNCSTRYDPSVQSIQRRVSAGGMDR